jgi:hypothetical protein
MPWSCWSFRFRFDQALDHFVTGTKERVQLSVAFPNGYVGRVIGKGGSRDAMNVGGAVVWLSVSMTYL